MKVLEINKEELIHNINIIKKINKVEDGLKSPEIIAVVKGNAYGLGLVEFSKILIEQGIEFLAVSTVEEALELRQNDIKCKILMLSSLSTPVVTFGPHGEFSKTISLHPPPFEPSMSQRSLSLAP